MAKKISDTSTFQVRAYEINARKEATLPSIINYMQEAAWHNAAQRGASVYLLHEHGVSWVLNRLKLEMFRYPSHLDTITVETWPSGQERFFVYRDYRIFDAKGELLGQATSTWIVFDLETRKLTLVPDFLKDLVGLSTPENQKPLPRASGKIRPPKEFEHSCNAYVRFHDLDINEHVNQTFYCQWAIEALPESFLRNHRLKTIELAFKAECGMGELIHSQAKQVEEKVFLHQLTQGDTQLTLAKTVWE